MKNPPNVLTIAGSDSGGGAGIQADLKTIFALGGFGTCAITALTAQNGLHVRGIFPVPPDFVCQQIASVEEGFTISAAKTGMLFSADIISAVCQALEKRSYPLVVDPVCVSQSGSKLLEDSAVTALKEKLLPMSDLLTPNLPEAELLCEMSLVSPDDILKAGSKLLTLVKGAVLIKGGHFDTSSQVTDYLFERGCEPQALSRERVITNNNHGTGCTLSAAIATGLAKGLSLRAAVTDAQDFVHCALTTSYSPGLGAGPVNHGCRFHNC